MGPFLCSEWVAESVRGYQSGTNFDLPVHGHSRQRWSFKPKIASATLVGRIGEILAVEHSSGSTGRVAAYRASSSRSVSKVRKGADFDASVPLTFP